LANRNHTDFQLRAKQRRQSDGSALTKKIATADEVRDDAFISFRNVCETAARYPRRHAASAGRMIEENFSLLSR
jgi:hypothetical protein